MPIQQMPAGGLVTDVTYPSWYNGTTDDASAPLKGEATASAILGLFAFGDAGVEAAAKNGNIKKIATVDHRITSYLFGLYWSYTTVVSGK